MHPFLIGARAGANIAINTLATGIGNGATPLLRSTLTCAGLRWAGPLATATGLGIAVASGYGLDQIKREFWPF